MTFPINFVSSLLKVEKSGNSIGYSQTTLVELHIQLKYELYGFKMLSFSLFTEDIIAILSKNILKTLAKSI